MAKIVFILMSLAALTVSIAFANSENSLQKGLDLTNEGNYDKAIEFFENSIAQNHDDYHIKAQSHLFLSEALWQIKKFDSALYSANIALEIFDSLDEVYWKGRVYYTTCMFNLIYGNYDLALMQAGLAFDAFRFAEDTAYQIRSICRRGVIFHDIGEYSQGIESCNEADSLLANYSNGNADLQASVWGIKAINFDDMGKSDLAVDIYKSILNLRENLSSDKQIILSYNNMGNSLMKLGLLDEAKKYIQMNLEAVTANNYAYGIATAKTNLATIAYLEADFSLSEKLMEEAKQISYDIKDKEKILDVLYQYYKLKEAMNQPEEAISFLKQYHQLKDSLYSIDKQRQIQFLEKSFETEQKENQIALQRAEIAENKAQLERNKVLLFGIGVLIVFIIIIALLNQNRIKRKQELSLQKEKSRIKDLELKAIIKSEEKERTRFARDLHDGIGQFISVLKLNLNRLKKDSQSSDLNNSVSESLDVTEKMYQELKNICFNLMPETLIQFGLVAVLEDFILRINSTGRVKINLDVFGLDKRPEEVIEISIYRIIQEWVNNILKYSDATSITIQITADESEISLLIENNGLGFNKEILINGNGFGWKNINSRANLIKADLEIDTSPGRPGTNLTLNCPLVSENTVKIPN